MTDYAADVKKYAQNVDAKAIKAIVNHLGIALKSADASLVACSSKHELARVRESWCKKKLGMTNPDADLDRGIQDICTKMKGDKDKSRVVFYYLLAEKYGKITSL